jgi:thiamine biosynthesis lipoprotein
MTPLVRLKTRQKPKTSNARWQFSALGTEWSIEIYQPASEEAVDLLKQRIEDRLEIFDRTYSRFRADSLITEISQHSGTYHFPADSLALFTLYESLYELTNGEVTPLIGNLMSATGYDATYSFNAGVPEIPSEWDEAISYHEGTLEVHKPVLLDFGAAGKGYAVDLVAQILQAEGISQFCVDAGGDMVVQGQETIRVGLEHPDNTEQVIGVTELANQALAGSAGNRRKWAGYHHIMNPETLQSVDQIKATWVVADSALVADGIATALFFVAPERLHQFTFEYLIINDLGQYKCSPDFPAELFKE